ncbi:DUF6201 family protein [Enterobacteriaceae bacterium ESL0689]|nr:DUF6201 family protein [Enterobacteriaceae bacterium ESL0689]
MLYEKYSPDKNYKVRVFYGGIISPVSLYKYLAAKNYFFILYDKEGNEIYKPSPYYGTSNIGASGDITFIYGDKHSLFFPGADGTYDAYDLPE